MVFTTELKERTRDAHARSDRLVNLRAVGVFSNRRTYAIALLQFFHIFSAIEEELERLDAQHSPYATPFNIPQLPRSKHFAADCEFYGGSQWRSALPVFAVTQDYVKRIHTQVSAHPHLIISYAYTMYLALLAGGQILKRLLRRTLRLSSQESMGMAIFDFEGKTGLARQVKEAVNALELSSSQREEIIREKEQVFGMNNRIIRALPVSVHDIVALVVAFKGWIVFVLGLFLLGMVMMYRWFVGK